ncbi:MAG: tetratricopeptide repeat protein [Pseudanabaena sp. SU_2_4]|nr:tetratricopeptide repeat protein [Pseudanabaena sp. SU_2_4]
MRKYDEALAAYEQATKVNRTSSFGLGLDMVRLLRFKLKYQEAIASYDKAISISPKYSYAWTGKGLALNGIGQRQDAIAATESATKIDPNSAYAWWAWALCSMKADAMKVHWRPQRKPSALMTSISMPGS